MDQLDIPFGPVFITEGPHAGRIGYFDDDGHEFPEDMDWDDFDDDDEDDLSKGTHVGYVYFGGPLLAKGYFAIPIEHLREVTTDDLMQRREELSILCSPFASLRDPDIDLDPEKELRLLAELHYVDSVLVDRMIQARYLNVTQGSKVFISHSSKDKMFATWLGTDLKAAGHSPWFDEWDIRVGESIPQKISEGLKAADFVVVVLSEHAVQSKWVEREWHAKYWSEVEAGRVQVLPVLLRDCEIPELLKTKKYADFRENYNNGLEDVLLALDSLLNPR